MRATTSNPVLSQTKAMAASVVEESFRCQAVAEHVKAEDVEEEDVFFTEEDYEMFSLKNYREESAQIKLVRQAMNWRDAVAEEKARQQRNLTKIQAKAQAKQAKKALRSSSDTQQIKPSSRVQQEPRYPSYSRLTVGQHKKFLDLQAKYGSKGSRVKTAQESAEHQQWRQLGAKIFQDQQDFNAYAEAMARSAPQGYLSIPAAAVQYITDALKKNLERVESLPRHYTVLQTFTLNPGVPLPSDPSLQRIGSPVLLGKVPEIQLPALLEDKTLTLKRALPPGQDLKQPKNNDSHETNLQKLAEAHSVDIVLSASTLLTLVNNHAPLYEHQWEIPLEVKEVTSDPSRHHRVVYLQKLLKKHIYYPYEANAVYHKLLLKRVVSTDSRDQYVEVADRDKVENSVMEMGEGDEEVEEDEFGAASLVDLETFGSECPAVEPMDVLVKQDVADDDDFKATELETLDRRGEGKGEGGLEDGSRMEMQMKVLPDSEEHVERKNNEVEIGNIQQNSQKEQSAPLSQSSVEAGPPERIRTTCPDVCGEELEGREGNISSVKDPSKDAVDADAMETSGGCDAGDTERFEENASTSKVSVVKVHVRRLSQSVINDADSRDFTNVKQLAADKDDGVLLRTQQQEEMMTEKKKTERSVACQDRKAVRMRFSSASSSDDEGKLMIVMHEKKSPQKAELQRITNAENRTGTATKMVTERDKKEDISRHESTEKERSDHSDIEIGEKEVGKCDEVPAMETGAPRRNGEKETKERVDEGPCERMATRRSVRIRKQSSSEEKASQDESKAEEAVPVKRRRGRPRKYPKPDEAAKRTGPGKSDGESKDDEGAMKDVEAKTNIETSTDGSVKKGLMDYENMTANKDSSAGDGSKSEKDAVKMKKGAQTELSMSLRTRGSARNSADVMSQREKISVKETDVILGGGVNKASSTVKERMAERPKHPIKQRSTVKKKVSPPKTEGRKKVEDQAEKSKTESTIDEIMRLQEKMLTRQKSNPSVLPQHSQGQRQGQEPQGHTQGHAGGMNHDDGIQGSGNEGLGLEPPEEGNYSYSLWKFGRLRLLLHHKNHGLLQGEMVSVVAKTEYQTGLGLEMQTASDLTRAWLNMYLRPGSKVIRGRVDSRTSEILSWESLDTSAIIQAQQTFSPGMCMKMLYHILMKVGSLGVGTFLLRHRPGDAHVCIYQCMDPSAKNVGASYDLHAAHQASKLMTSLPPTIPWVPLDPSAPYRSERWRGRVPLTFRPCPANFKHPSTQHQQGGKRRKKKTKR